MTAEMFIAAATSASKTAATAASAAVMTIVGIPVSLLTAGIVGALASLYLSKDPKEKIPLIISGVLVKAFVGAWVALSLPKLPMFSFSADIQPEVLAGLCAIFVQTAYKLAIEWGNKKAKTDSKEETP